MESPNNKIWQISLYGNFHQLQNFFIFQRPYNFYMEILFKKSFYLFNEKNYRKNR